ncbi:MAG TPA: MerR family transcriptional regulator [Candidatus Competibacteraceae bacterium]|nr:MerR family transcriptional regulator [Candidatus Competibacteraceae bacterium]
MVSNDPLQEASALPRNGLVPIRTVASLTGVNPVTLRAWERRYGLIRPVRTAKGHRLYSMHDVELIQRVLTLLDAGMSIGQVCHVLRGESLGAGHPQPGPAEEHVDPWQDYRRQMVKAIADFDDIALDDLYNQVLSLYPVDSVTGRLIVPLLHELGWRWERGEGGVAEEHFFSVFLRNKLGARLHHQRRGLSGPRLLAATLPGEHHEIGLLLFALAAMDRNYRVLLLGSDMLLEELPLLVNRTHCQAIVLAGSLVTPVKLVRHNLARLVREVCVPVFVGGQVTARYAEEIVKAGALALGEDLGLALRIIDGRLTQAGAA